LPNPITPPSETGVPARRAALQLLDAVLRRGQPLEHALAAATKGIDNPADRALAHAIASEVLRRTPDLDDLIDGATRQRLPDDAKARMVLRMALAQTLIMGTPPHAAISTALPLVEGGPKRLVHGVFGTLMRGGAKLRSAPMLLPGVEQRWGEAWGSTMLNQACLAMTGQSPIDLTIKDPSQTAHWADALSGESLAPGHVRIGRDRPIPTLPGFDEGAWWVQNISASIPARLLGAGNGRAALDLCAAPGGKTMQLAAQGWDVTALERDGTRLERVTENLTRTGLSAKLVEADALRWKTDQRFDAILLDAPCSATGIFANHPDVLHRVRPKDIVALADVQMRMFQAAAEWLSDDGVLVYATCSLEPDEGENVAKRSESVGLKTDPVKPQELVAGVKPTPNGWVRILPSVGMDGFFVARFKRA
jgi:16S rRNA (cytosine967-C5)-methyltransferase